MSGERSAERDEPCCAHPKCPGGSLCCCQSAEKDAHDPRCYQRTGGIPDDLPGDLCDCRVYRTIDAQAGHGYGETSDCLCGRNFATVRGLREHITKSRVTPPAAE